MKNFKVKNFDTKIGTEFIATVSECGYLEKKEEATKQDGTKYKRTVLDDNNKPIIDTSKVYFQTLIWNEDKGDFDINQFYLEEEMSLEKIKSMKNKTFKFKDFMENNGYMTIKGILEEVKSEETIFSIKKSIVAILDNISEKEVKDRDTKKVISHNVNLQVISSNGGKLNIKNIKIKDKRLTPELKALKDKKVLIDNLKIVSFNGNVYFSTETAPKEVK